MRRVLYFPVLPYKRPVVFLSLATLLLTSLTACANSPVGKNLEQSLAADPKLKDNPATFGQQVTNTNPPNETVVQLPADFPSEIPRYPGATVKEVTQQNASPLTRWTTSDPSNFVQNFYKKQFQDKSWEIIRQPADEMGGTLVARRNGLQVTVNIQPTQTSIAAPSPNQPTANQTPSAATEFTIQYAQGNIPTATEPTDNPAIATLPTDNTPSVTPQPSPSNTSQPTPSPDVTTQPTTTPEASNANNIVDSSTQSQAFSDINKAPGELRSYITDLAQLGVLPLNPTGSKSDQSATSIALEPNKLISRREYALWLVTANNRMYANDPAKQIRLATQASTPAFQDVPRTDAYFPYIQGLAEAGLIPSPLSGDSTAVLFRPGAALSREQMILWKVPLDTRQSLPNATADAVKQTWGFQDTSKINPTALRAILADFQNGNVSNIRRVFGFTTLFQPQKPVTRAEAAGTLWYFGTQGEGVSAKEAMQLKPQSN